MTCLPGRFEGWAESNADEIYYCGQVKSGTTGSKQAGRTKRRRIFAL